MEQHEIFLCRGKRTDNEKWVEGYYVCLMSNQHRIYTGYAETDTDGYAKTYYPDFYMVDPETIGQYIGRTDKNGTKIFEGDICRFKDNEGEYSNYKIVRNENSYVVISSEGCVDDLDQFFAERSEVIGNIYDNPELLEVAK